MIVTDQRVCFATADGDLLDGGSIRYGDITGVEFTHKRTTVVELTTTESEAWRYAFPNADKTTLDAIERHLSWIGTLRGIITRFQNDIELAVGKMDELADEMEWEAAQERYAELRDELDRVIVAVQLTAPIDDEILAPELTSMERTLENAHVRLHIERARSELELGQYLIENEEHDRARTVLERAQTHYDRARDGSEAIERADAFQFGTQRELEKDLESVGWEIESVAAEPLRQATDAQVQATAADDREEALTHWQNAFERYELFLELELGGEERSFADEASKAMEGRSTAAKRLIQLHRDIAKDTWNEGAGAQRRGDHKAALKQFHIARDHLGTAYELARAFNPVKANELKPKIQAMTETIAGIRRTSSGEPASDATSPSAEQPADAGGTDDPGTADSIAAAETSGDGDEDLPTVTDLLEMDSHHEITLDISNIGSAEASTRDSSPNESDDARVQDSPDTGLRPVEGTHSNEDVDPGMDAPEGE